MPELPQWVGPSGNFVRGIQRINSHYNHIATIFFLGARRRPQDELVEAWFNAAGQGLTEHGGLPIDASDPCPTMPRGNDAGCGAPAAERAQFFTWRIRTPRMAIQTVEFQRSPTRGRSPLSQSLRQTAQAVAHAMRSSSMEQVSPIAQLFGSHRTRVKPSPPVPARTQYIDLPAMRI